MPVFSGIGHRRKQRKIRSIAFNKRRCSSQKERESRRKKTAIELNRETALMRQAHSIRSDLLACFREAVSQRRRNERERDFISSWPCFNMARNAYGLETSFNALMMENKFYVECVNQFQFRFLRYNDLIWYIPGEMSSRVGFDGCVFGLFMEKYNLTMVSKTNEDKYGWHSTLYGIEPNLNYVR